MNELALNIYQQFKGNNPFASQAKMLLHGDRLHQYVTTGDSQPLFCEVNLTNVCNLKCVWCISENFERKNIYLKPEYLKHFIEQFKAIGGKALTWTGGGEPTIYKHFVEVTEYATAHGIDLGLMSNGIYSTSINDTIGTHFKWIRFSVDTLNKAHYKLWKVVEKVDNVINNTAYLRKNYPELKLGINCNVHPDLTEAEVDELVEFAEKYDVGFLQFRPILPRYFKHEKVNINHNIWEKIFALEDNPRVNFSMDKFKDIEKENLFPFTKCEAHCFNFVLNSNGDVLVCMYHPNDDRFVFGNIYESSLNDIWQSERRQQVIKFLRNELNVKESCQACCKLCELNKLCEFINHTKITSDKNFL